jgi:hypothetical protein
VVKLSPCDQEVAGSSPGNSLFKICRERLRTETPSGSDPSPYPAQKRMLHAPCCPYLILYFITHHSDLEHPYELKLNERLAFIGICLDVQ